MSSKSAAAQDTKDDNEPSMEEILASIRKIIADDSLGTKKDEPQARKPAKKEPEPEPGPQISGRNPADPHHGLAEEGPGAAHGVMEGPLAPPAGECHHGGGQGLLHGGLHGLAPVASAVERPSRGVEADEEGGDEAGVQAMASA